MGYNGASVAAPSSYSPMTQMDTPLRVRGQRRHEHPPQVELPTYSQLARSPTALPPPPENSTTVIDGHTRRHDHPLAWSTPSAVLINSEPLPRPQPPDAPSVWADASDVLLVDLGSRSLVKEDLEKALRLWTRPAILIAGRNSLERLPANVPGSILFLDLSWNR